MELLEEAADKGVEILAYETAISPEEIILTDKRIEWQR